MLGTWVSDVGKLGMLCADANAGYSLVSCEVVWRACVVCVLREKAFTIGFH